MDEPEIADFAAESALAEFVQIGVAEDKTGVAAAPERIRQRSDDLFFLIDLDRQQPVGGATRTLMCRHSPGTKGKRVLA